MARTHRLRISSEMPYGYIPVNLYGDLKQFMNALPSHYKKDFRDSGPEVFNRFNSYYAARAAVDANVRLFADSNPHASRDLSDAVETIFSGQGARVLRMTSRSRNESDLFSTFALNEFLAQSTHETYGEFLDEHWDRIYEDLLKLRLTEYSHTLELVKKNENLLSHRRALKKEQVSKIESMTLDNVRKILSYPNGSMKISTNSVIIKINILISDEKLKVEMDRLQLGNTLMLAFAKSLASDPLSNTYSYGKLATLVTSSISTMTRLRTTEIMHEIAPTRLHVKSFSSLTTFLSKNAEEFTLLEMIALIFIMSHKKTVTDDPNYKLFIDFLNRVVTESDADKAVTIFKLLADVALTLKIEPPTLKDWVREFEADNLADGMNTYTTIILTKTKASKDVSNNEILNFRRIVSDAKELSE